MVNARFLYGNLAGDAAATASVGSGTATAATYDPQNVTALDRDTTWLAGSTTTPRLILHTGAAITPQALAIAAGNYSVWGTTKLQHSTDGVTWTDFLTLASLPSVDTIQDYFAELTAAPSKSWWALYWAAPSAAPEVAIFYLATLATVAESYNYPTEEQDVFNVDLQVAENRGIVGEEVARYIVRFLWDWAETTSTTKELIRTIIRACGGPKTPLFIVPVDESGSSTAGRCYLVRYQTTVLALKRLFVDPFDLSAAFLEEV